MNYVQTRLMELHGNVLYYNERLDDLVALQIYDRWFTCPMREVGNVEQSLRINRVCVEKEYTEPPKGKGQRRASIEKLVVKIKTDTGMCGRQAIVDQKISLRGHLAGFECAEHSTCPDTNFAFKWDGSVGDPSSLFSGEFKELPTPKKTPRTDYVVRGSYKPEAFLRMLSKHLTLDADFNLDEGEGVYYLGGGYWRASLVETRDDGVLGLKLINPDRTSEEIADITKAMNILIRG